MVLSQLYTPALALKVDDEEDKTGEGGSSSSSGGSKKKRKRPSSLRPEDPAAASHATPLGKLRPIRIDLSPLSAATGSSYVELGDTKVLVAVFGPSPQNEGGGAGAGGGTRPA